MKLEELIIPTFIVGAGASQCSLPGSERPLECVVEQIEEPVAVLECRYSEAMTELIEIPSQVLPPGMNEGGLILIRIGD
jgi:hypothetical protein